MLLKRQLTILSLLVVAALLSMTATAHSFLQREAAEKFSPAAEEKYSSYQTAAYILKEQDGYVAVFSSNADRLLEMTAIPVSTLGRTDRALLESGITAADRQALLRLLEDLNS